MSNFAITVLSDSDWREYKSIRLESLQDSPDSFGSTYAREASFTPEQWQSRLRGSPAISNTLALAAIDDQTFIGLASGAMHAPDIKNAHVYQMWVAPEFRGIGVGTALINRIISWAVNNGCRKTTVICNDNKSGGDVALSIYWI